MKHIYYLISIFIIIVFISHGCNYGDSLLTNPHSSSYGEFSDGPVDTGLSVIDYSKSYTTNLITSNNTVIGTLKVRLDTLNFYFKFTVNNQYYLKNIHLSVTQLLNRIPLTGNCPNVNNFNHQVYNLPANTRTYSFVIPTASMELSRNTLFVSAKIDYENSSFSPECLVAWAKGVPFPNCNEFSKYFGLRYYFKKS